MSKVRRVGVLVGFALACGLWVVPVHADGLLKLSTAYTRMLFLVDSSDHVSGKTGATVTCTLSKAGGSFGASGGSVTEVSSGWYKIALNTTDTNTLGQLAYHCTATGADATNFADRVIAIDLGDAVRLGLSALPNAAAEAAGGLYTRGTGAGQVNQPANGMLDGNAVRWGGVAVAAADANGRIKVLTGVTKNVALANMEFEMTDSTTHLPKTGIAGGSFTKQYSLDGAAYASLSGTVVEVSTGTYKINLSAGELNGNVVSFRFAAAGADDTKFTIILSQ